MCCCVGHRCWASSVGAAPGGNDTGLSKHEGTISACTRRSGKERKAEMFAEGNGLVTHRAFSLGVCFPRLARGA